MTNFAWAIRQAIEGKVIRRKGRLIGNEGYVLDQGELRRLLGGMPGVGGVVLRAADLEATDWEVVDESHPTPDP